MVLNLKMIREQRGITISQLSYKSGVARSYITELEIEKYINPSLAVICKLCIALNLTQNELISKDYWNFKKR